MTPHLFTWFEREPTLSDLEFCIARSVLPLYLPNDGARLTLWRRVLAWYG